MTASSPTTTDRGPQADQKDPEARRKARLLKTFLLLMAAVFGASDLFNVLTRAHYVPPWYGYAFLLSAILLNRAGRYTWSAALTLAMFPLVCLVMVLSGADPGPTFNYLIIGVITSSLLLNRRGAIFFDGACLIGLLLTPLLIPEHVPSFRAILSPSIVLALGSGLSIVLMIHRDEVERDRQGALRASEERLILALDAARMGTWEWDTTSRVVHASLRAEALFGFAPRTFDGTPAGYLGAVHPDDVAAVEKELADVFSGHRADFEILHRVMWADGSAHWLHVQGRSTGREGEAWRVNGTVLDVTDRKHAEVERSALIQELEQKNAELERFTYTVSHDLKSPLITIRGFLGSIEKDVKDGRFDRLGVDVERIFNATTRMQKLLEELLNLSRIGRLANPPEQVAIADLAREAMAAVRGRLDAAHARVEIRDGLPDVFGDRTRLVQVFQNLLDNAAKSLSDHKNPRIVIGTRPSVSDGRPVFYVEDNGIGVDPANLERILGLFQRVDDRSEGTGVGLAIVKRIVEVHGGRLWVESKGRGTGATVCFTLPTRPPV